MSAVPAYTPVNDFSQDEANAVAGRSTVLTAELDQELSNIALSIAGLITKTTAVVRADNVLLDAVVSVASLSSAVLDLIGGGNYSFNAAGSTWITATAYSVNQLVMQGTGTYVCSLAHTSGVFATDFAAGKWVRLFDPASLTAAAVSFTPTGTVASANVQAAIAELDTEKLAIGATIAGTLVTNTPAGGIAAVTAQAAINELDTEKANLASPTFTGTPTLPTGTVAVTQTTGDSSTKLATTAFVAATITNVQYPKNRLRNGSMEIWQRGTTLSVAASSSGFGPDRWLLETNANQACTMTQVAAIGATSQFACKFQRNNGQTGTTGILLEQPFELLDIAPLLGQIVTLSFVAKAGANYSPSSSLLAVQLFCGTGAAARRFSGYTNETTPILTACTLTTTPTRFTFTSTAIPTSTRQMSLAFVFNPTGTAGADDSFTMDEVQLEIGSVYTGLEFTEFDHDLRRCQRYYSKTFPYGTAPAQNTGSQVGAHGSQGISGQVGPCGTWRYPVTMRIAPTITTFNPNAANANWRDRGNTADVTVQVDTAADSGVFISSTGAVSSTYYLVHLTASAEF